MENAQADYISGAIRKMVALERYGPVDWPAVFALADETLQFIVRNGLDGQLDRYVIKFLDDCDVRKKDAKYGEYQRDKIMEILSSGLIG